MKYLKLFYLLITIIVLTSCNSTNATLNAIEMNAGFITPNDGLKLTDARKLIIEELEKRDVKGDIESVAIIEEITTEEFWSSVGAQLYKVDVDYAWINGVAIIKDNKVLEILIGMPTLGIFIADLDEDCIYEVYTNIATGSGLVSYNILGYNIATQDTYSLSNRGKQDFTLFIKDNVLMAKVTKFSSIHEIEKTGKLLIEKDINKGKIYIE